MKVGTTLAGFVGASLLAVTPAFAISEGDSDLAELREQMQSLQERLQAQEEQMHHQAELLDEAHQAVREQQRDTESLSAVAEFWNAIDVNMSTAGSYAWNFNNPDLDGVGGVPGFPGAGANSGSSGLFYPFHPDHNSFQVDQVWFDIGKEATDESRAGFQFTLLYGNTAAFLGQGGNLAPRRAFNDSTSDYYINQAYVNYLAPIGEGVDFRFGKFATLIGAEVGDTTQNFNITNGNVYNLLQPIDHLGVLASTTVGPISLAGGLVNQGNLSVSSPDINKEKSYLASVGFGQDNLSAGVTLLYGAEGGAAGVATPGDNSKKVGTLDFLVSLSGDAFEAWLNADYVWVQGAEASAWGFAAAGRLPITDVFSAAVRAEYAHDKNDFFGILGPRNSEIFGLTGTLAYELVENLTLRGELRWDRVVEDAGPFDEFFTTTAGGSEDQVVALAQIYYDF